MFGFLRSRPDFRAPAAQLYESIVAASRQPWFYQQGVPDTLDGRFELLILHLWLVVRRLRGQANGLAQALFEHAFAVLDLNVREMGVGDLGVGRRIKAMGQAYYGRAEVYEAGLAVGDLVGGDLAAALSRNLFGTLPEAPPAALVQPFVDYVRRQVAHLDVQAIAALSQGQLSWSEAS